MEASRVSSSHFRFGHCEIDAATRSLTRRARPVEIEPRVFDLLLHLIDNHHRVVSSDELLDAVWRGAAVTPSSVSQAVHKARIAIGDRKRTQRSIATVRGHGFRFVAPLRVGWDEPGEPAEGGLVGRSVEIARLVRAIDRTRRGHGGLVYITGAPGIGKTRVVREIVARARARDVEAFVARCVEGDDAIAFGPWRQLARKLAKSHTPAELDRLGARRAHELLAAERELVRAAEAGLAQPPFDAPTLSRLFASATEGLARLARKHPLLLLLEDVHRADLASLLFLRFLAHSLRELPILLVATFRDGDLANGDRRARLLAEAQRAGDGETLTLEALSLEEMLRLAEQCVTAPIAAPLLDALCALSGGNPFLLGELLRLPRLRVDPGGSPGPPGLLELPPIVRTSISEQLGRLGAQGRRVLGMAAVLGFEFELPSLAAALGLAPQKVFRSLCEAASLRVLVPLAKPAHAFRFAHALVREALYEDLPPQRRARFHLRAACALEATSSAGPALLAYHFAEAAAVGGAERGVEAAREAARLSAERLDFERASRELELALRCLDFVPGASPLRRAEILLDAGRAAIDVDPQRGSRLLAESARIARRLGSSARALLGAIALAAAQGDAAALGAGAALPVCPALVPDGGDAESSRRTLRR